MHRRRLFLGAIALFLLSPVAVEAARYHVAPGGLRTTGPSDPGNWSESNCYAEPAAALLAAGPADSVLLARAVHQLVGVVRLPAFLGNADLDGVAQGCRLDFVTGAQLLCDGTAPRPAVRGLALTGVAGGSSVPAILVTGAAPALQELRLEDCSCFGHHLTVYEGGAFLRGGGDGQGAHITLRRCVVRSCTAAGLGGALQIGDGFTVALDQCVVVDNSALSGGGGALAIKSWQNVSNLILTACLFDSNRANGPGGALYVEDAGLTLTGTTVSHNRSADSGTNNWSAGAGVFMRRAGPGTGPLSLLIDDSRFVENVGNLAAGIGAGDGGGVLVKGADPSRMVQVSVSRSCFEHNFNDQGAGLYIGRYAVGSVERCTFVGNIACTNGGGAYKGGANYDNLGETATFIFCLFQDNRAGYGPDGLPNALGGSGGGFMTRRYPRAEFTHCTFLDNLCGTVAGSVGDALCHSAENSLFADARQRCPLVNCLFWGEQQHDVQVRSDPNGFGEITHCAYAPDQLVGLGTVPTGTVSLLSSPCVGPGDSRLRVDSPCVDAGEDRGLSPDIEGAAVPRGSGPDIGAYENVFPVGVTPTVGGTTLTAVPNPFNPRTELAFSLAQSGPIRLRLFDVRGRFVATLAEGQRAAGPQTVLWSGRDAEGRCVSAGLFIARLETASETRTLKLSLVR